MDIAEHEHPPQKPLLPFIEQADMDIPKKWDWHTGQLVTNEDRLLWDLRPHDAGATVEGPRQKTE